MTKHYIASGYPKHERPLDPADFHNSKTAYGYTFDDVLQYAELYYSRHQTDISQGKNHAIAVKVFEASDINNPVFIDYIEYADLEAVRKAHSEIVLGYTNPNENPIRILATEEEAGENFAKLVGAVE